MRYKLLARFANATLVGRTRRHWFMLIDCQPEQWQQSYALCGTDYRLLKQSPHRGRTTRPPAARCPSQCCVQQLSIFQMLVAALNGQLRLTRNSGVRHCRMTLPRYDHGKLTKIGNLPFRNPNAPVIRFAVATSVVSSPLQVALAQPLRRQSATVSANAWTCTYGRQSKRSRQAWHRQQQVQEDTQAGPSCSVRKQTLGPGLGRRS